MRQSILIAVMLASLLSLAQQSAETPPATQPETPAVAAPEVSQAAADLAHQYRVLSTVKIKTLQRELNDAAASNYRVKFGDAGHNILILEKTPDRYEYRVVHNFKEEFKAAAAEKFLIVPATFSAESRGIIMERCEGASTVHDYLLLDTFRSGTLQKELNEGAGKGYVLAAFSSYALNNVLMEKRSQDAPAIPDRYLLLGNSGTSNMQHQMSDAAAKGYVVVAGSGGSELKIVMEKAQRAPEYRLLATARSSTLEKEINQSSAAGFRPVYGTLMATNHQSSFFGNYRQPETCIVMEKVEQPEDYTYRIIGTSRPATFEKELSAAAAEGFEIVDFTLSYSEQVGLLRRAGTR